MPKKRNHNFKQLQGTSSSNPSSSKTNGENGSPSVNERLSELRKLEAKDAAAKKRELADSVNRRSVPPQVQGILGVAESAPPKPKAGTRTRDRLRTPGPAPPKSWLTSDSPWTSALALRGARRGFKKGANKTERNRPKELLRFAHLSGLETVSENGRSITLTHLALKAVAESWELFDEDDYPAILEVPLRLRLRLISYIGFYGPTLNASGIQFLLQGTEKVDHLDLGGLLGHENLTLKRIGKTLARSDRDESHESSPLLAESWDADESLHVSIRPSLAVNRTSQLTHLCLSHPGPGASWRDLLAFSKIVPQLTHLSLAYWPWPTLTPNLATTTVASQHSPEVTASSSYYYAALDQDMEEPAILLRQLSSHLLCLQWLDVEGCQAWTPALAELADTCLKVHASSIRRPTIDRWIIDDTKDIPVLASNWRNLTHIRCGQGWLPSYWGMRLLLESARQEFTQDETRIGKALMYHYDPNPLRVEMPHEGLNHDMIDVEKRRARIWLQSECRTTQASVRINLARIHHPRKVITMDFGYITRPGDPRNIGIPSSR